LLDEEMQKAVSNGPKRASRLWERTAIATLDSSGIDPKTIAWFVERDLRTVHRWIGRIHNGHDLYDDKRSGRPPIYDEELTCFTRRPKVVYTFGAKMERGPLHRHDAESADLGLRSTASIRGV